MGYLNSSIITVDAILTRKGRELLAKGDQSFNITQFALSDDEIDYTLYNLNNPSGSAYYGEAIENMPLLEAFPDENQMMKYKLITLPRGTSNIPIISAGISNISLRQSSTLTISPETLNYGGASSTTESSYAFTISDVRLFSSFYSNTQSANTISVYGTNVSKTVVGKSVTIKATGISTLFGTNSTLQAYLIIVGNDSGARVQLPVTINKISNS